MNDQIDSLVATSIQHFNRLKSTLKPSKDQWTSFASIVSSKNDDLKCICFCLGTKLVAGKKSKLKNLIIDCHAENLCRRAFKLYLISKLNQGCSIEDLESTEYHLIISQLPCGLINRYKGSTDASLRKKPGRNELGELCSKSTCFDKILKWSVLGLQGRKLSSILKNPIRFKSIIIGDCSLELREEDKNVFRDAFNLEISSELEKCLRLFLNRQNLDLGDNILEPKRKKLKSETLDHSDNESNLELKSSPELLNLIRPEIHFCTKLSNEMFIKRDHKKAEDRSIVYYLDTKNEYKTEVIADGRKFGTNLNNHERVRLGISPSSINELIEMQLTSRNIDLSANESVRNYDRMWEELKKHPNFVRWSNCLPK